MRITIKIGLLFAAIWITFKLVMFYAGGTSNYDLKPFVLANILCILLAVSVGLYLQKRRDKEETTALTDIKNGLSAGLPYAIITSVFLFMFYTYIDTDYVPHKLAEAEVQIDSIIENPEEFKKLKASNEEFEVLPKEEIKQKLVENSKSVYSPGFTMTSSMLALLVLGTVNSIFVTIIYRRIVFKQ